MRRRNGGRRADICCGGEKTKGLGVDLVPQEDWARREADMAAAFVDFLERAGEGGLTIAIARSNGEDARGRRADFVLGSLPGSRAER